MPHRATGRQQYIKLSTDRPWLGFQSLFTWKYNWSDAIVTRKIFGGVLVHKSGFIYDYSEVKVITCLLFNYEKDWTLEKSALSECIISQAGGSDN